MAVPAPSPIWTAERVRNELIREDRHWPRYELVDGELLVTPAPRMRHQVAVQWLFLRLAPYTREHGIGRTMLSPADISFDRKSIVQPDVFVIPQEQARVAREWPDVTALLLAVETLSAGSERHDRRVKRPHYQRHQVGEAWIVDLDAELVERWRPDDERPEVLTTRLVWTPADGVPPLELDLGELFAEASA